MGTLTTDFSRVSQREDDLSVGLPLSGTEPRVAVYTLGCKLNYSEGDTISRQFTSKGYRLVEFDNEAEVYVINTCSVTDHADRKCKNLVQQARRTSPQARVVVTGCFAQLQPGAVSQIPGVDLVVGGADKFRILQKLNIKSSGGIMAEIHHGETRALTTFEHSFSQGNRTRSFLKVQDGCDYSCTFCTIPGARGASRSGNPHELLQQAKDLVASGVREIVLTGVNTGDYGWVGGDLNRGPSRPLGNFGDLLSLLAEESGAERLRISSVEPNLLTDRIIELMKKHPNLMPHVHMPLQSGSDALLARMKRRYRSAQYADRVQAVRSALPHACIGVDVIVGFPSETDGLFMETHDFIRDLEVSYLHVFTYSERPGTEAAAMEGRVPNGRRSDRNRLLTHLGLRKRLDFAQSHLGSMRPVLFEQERKGQWMQGYTDNYIRVSAPYNPLWINRIVPVELASIEADGTVLCRVNASDQLMAEDHFVFQP